MTVMQNGVTWSLSVLFVQCR